MKTRISFPNSLSEKVIWFGVGLAVLYWFMESAIHAFVHQIGSFYEQLIPQDIHEIWMRSLVVIIILSFSVYAQLIINNRRRFEETLSQSEAKFRGVVEQSNDGVYVLQENRFVFINPRFSEIMGYELAEVSGKDFDYRQLVAEEGRPILAEREAMRKRGEEPPSYYVLKGLRKDGKEIDLGISVSVIDWEGDPAILGTLRDVTERIDTRKELEETLKRAEESDRLKSLFLANMSHEIRTPLNSILGFTDIVEKEVGPALTPEVQNYFNIIRDGGNRLMRTVHEILDISQIEAGGFNVKRKPLNLVALINMAVEEYRPAAKVKKLKLTFSPEVETAVINADEYCLKQVCANLIDNAIKFTAEGEVKIVLRADENKAIVVVKDTGIGISEEYLDNIFEAFSQESTGYTRKYEGIGLGLALTKRYLEMNDATIDVDSQKDIGTTVTLSFPLVSMKEERGPVIEPKVIPGTDKKKKPLILLVEDDVHSQELTTAFLKKDYNNILAASVEEAKKQLEENPVDGILLDLSLQGDEDGLDLVRYLRKTKKWKDLPVIALTAHAFVTDRENSLAVGCNDYLTKPVNRETLLEKIKLYF